MSIELKKGLRISCCRRIWSNLAKVDEGRRRWEREGVYVLFGWMLGNGCQGAGCGFLRVVEWMGEERILGKFGGGEAIRKRDAGGVDKGECLIAN